MFCALTGHRDLPENFNINALYDGLEELIKEGYTSFLCGMAAGFDLCALQCLIDLKKKYHERIFVEACVPYIGQEKNMCAADRERYRTLLPLCDRKTVLFEHYAEGCFLARDKYMVDHADLVFAYCTRSRGGTAFTVAYAQKNGIGVRFLEV